MPPKKTTFNNTALPVSLMNTSQTETPGITQPNALYATLSASGSVVLVCGTVSTLFSWSYTWGILFALIPWSIYGLGRFIILILILWDDIALFWPHRANQSDVLTIIKEN